jgi:serine/threonine-protein kinase
MDTERNLLFGVLALQADLIDAVQFAEACTAWSMRKEPPLAELLLERGWITREDQVHVEYLLERKLKRHGGDVHASLASVANEGMRRSLLAIGDEAIQQSLANVTPPVVGGDPGMTRSGISLPEHSPSGRPLVTTFTYETETRDRYRLIHLHAVGGIGQIWLSRDGDLDRTVALKELRPEAAKSPRMRARFLDEARITGQLEHPGIIPVYELARRANDQQPFYTMRFLKGRTLTEAVRVYHEKRAAGKAGSLDLLGLLNAFVAVCNAMAYAHARGVIHRDLKGQNVILGDFGEVIVLDWGLAKVVTRASDSDVEPVALEQEVDREQTLQGQVLGTPAYMAPEQATGRQDLVDSRTDVYGLGAVLYEILTGQPPFTGATTNEVLKKVQGEEPARPRQIWAGVPPALEAVCLRALAKRQAKRYPSAVELAREVQRWLADEPVAAYWEPFAARLGRWARRHKPLVAGTAALLITAIPALLISNILIGRQQARAEANFQMARDAVDRFYVRVSEEQLLNEPGMQPLRKDLLQTAQEFYQKFADENQNDPRRQADLGNVLLKLAKITGEVGDDVRMDFKSVLQQARALMERALGIFQQLSNRKPEVPEYRSSQAACHLGIGALYHSEDRPRAEAAYKSALNIYQSLAQDYPTVLDYQNKLARCYLDLGVLYEGMGRQPEAESAHLKALDIQQQLADHDPGNFEYQADLAGIHSNLGNFYSAARKWDQAREHHLKALAIRNELVRRSPRVLQFQTELAQSYNNLGMLGLATGQLPEAERHLTRSLTIRETLARRNPSVTSYQRNLAASHGNLGTLYHKMRRIEEADKAYKTAVAILEALVVDVPKETRFALDLGETQLGLGYFFSKESKFEAALGWYSRAIDTLQAAFPPGHSFSAARQALRDAYWSRAQALSALERKEQAVAEFDRAIELDDGPNRPEIRLERADSLARLRKHAQATTEADALAQEEDVRTDSLYQLARIFSLCSEAVRLDTQITPADRAKLAAQYAARAVELLTWAHSAGYFKDPVHLQTLEKDNDLDSLRRREDFRKLVKDLAR